MRGTVLGFDAGSRTGAISGSDGQRYNFDAGEWRGGTGGPSAGAAVDFDDAAGGFATAIYPVAAAVGAPAQSYAGGAQPAHAGAGAYPKSPIVAGLLALFLGGLGVHKFYLGYTTEGAILLGATILSILLTLVIIGIFGLMAISIVCLVEAVIYLTKPEPEFNRLYVEHKKPWF